MKERSYLLSPVASWLSAVALFFIVLIASYIFLHSGHKFRPSFALRDGLVLEVIYWSLFGAATQVLMTIVYKLSKQETVLNGKDVLFQSLQLLLAPVFALLLFALLYYTKEKETLDKSFILSAFIAGLLSGHLLLLFRNNDISFDGVTLTGQTGTSHNAKEIKEEGKETSYGLLPCSIAMINLELDDAGLFFEEKTEILKQGLTNASVTLQKNNHSEILAASKYDKKGNFIAEDLEPATYTVRAMQSVRMKDNSVLNLFGEKEIKITNDENYIKLPLKKL